jgi:hypothetical protein
MPLTKIKSLGITDGTILGTDVNSTFDLTGKTVTLPAGVGGKVLQVVSATTTTAVSSSSSTFVDTNLTASITPSSASNKILVIIHQNGIKKSSGDNFNDIALKLVRGATDISTISLFALFTGSSLTIIGSTLSTTYLDSPATTSSTTYKTQFKNADGAGVVEVQDSGEMSTITLMEIAA